MSIIINGNTILPKPYKPIININAATTLTNTNHDIIGSGIIQGTLNLPVNVPKGEYVRILTTTFKSLIIKPPVGESIYTNNQHTAIFRGIAKKISDTEWILWGIPDVTYIPPPPSTKARLTSIPNAINIDIVNIDKSVNKLFIQDPSYLHIYTSTNGILSGPVSTPWYNLTFSGAVISEIRVAKGLGNRLYVFDVNIGYIAYKISTDLGTTWSDMATIYNIYAQSSYWGSPNQSSTHYGCNLLLSTTGKMMTYDMWNGGQYITIEESPNSGTFKVGNITPQYVNRVMFNLPSGNTHIAQVAINYVYGKILYLRSVDEGNSWSTKTLYGDDNISSTFINHGVYFDVNTLVIYVVTIHIINDNYILQLYTTADQTNANIVGTPLDNPILTHKQTISTPKLYTSIQCDVDCIFNDTHLYVATIYGKNPCVFKYDNKLNTQLGNIIYTDDILNDIMGFNIKMTRIGDNGISMICNQYNTNNTFYYNNIVF